MLHVPKQLPSSKVGNKLKQYINSQLREMCEKRQNLSTCYEINAYIYILLT